MEAESNASNSGYAASGTPNVLESTDREAFTRSVERAKREAIDAAEAANDLGQWALRLAPYFDRDPQLTVAEALQLYLAARPKASPDGVASRIE